MAKKAAKKAGKTAVKKASPPRKAAPKAAAGKSVKASGCPFAGEAGYSAALRVEDGWLVCYDRTAGPPWLTKKQLPWDSGSRYLVTWRPAKGKVKFRAYGKRGDALLAMRQGMEALGFSGGEAPNKTQPSTSLVAELNERELRFCECLVWKQMTHKAALAEAGYADDPSYAWHLLRKPHIKATVEALRKERQSLEYISKEEVAALMAQALRTPVGAVGADHILADEVRIDEHGIDVKMIKKKDAADWLAKVYGWYKEDSSGKRGVDKLASLLAQGFGGYK